MTKHIAGNPSWTAIRIDHRPLAGPCQIRNNQGERVYCNAVGTVKMVRQ
jgi:hypothetical protein